ncbi:alpha/beta hydrolase-fold protein [Solirubrobacter soli]|uniref:alpha/beta hydrolase-fold protein n=1 Tax=Solirubrobacter soli TaxID=363832 RepID=UPI000487F9A1|nr:Ig-like domain repeat protein [Solirubrobacter soli]
MHVFRRAGLGALAALAFAAPAHAQNVVSPEVTHTGTGPTGYTVTFRISDPTATRMRIRGEWFFSSAADTTTTTSAGRLPSQWKVGDFPIANPNNGAAANWPVADMTKGADGVWTYTTPMPSGTYTYGYYRNCDAAAPNLPGCTEISDPSNPPFNTVGGVTTGAVEPTSQVYVPSDPAFGTEDLSQEAPNAVHGTVTDLTYNDPESTNPVGQHYVAVYTPPGYDAHRALAYPTLYISHGAGGVEADWFTQGVAGRIIDNLIAAGKMQPAVVVSTNFNGLPNGNVGYQNDVLNRVIPFIEANFNVSHNANDRAFGGLSAGGSRANQLIFNATTAFGYFATWSIGTGGAPAAGSPLYANPDLKTRLGLVVGGGRFDSITVSKATLEQRLTDNGVPFIDDTIDGGHEWYTWRKLLHDYAAGVAFRQTSVALTTSGNAVTATVTPGTNEPVAPSGTVQFSAGGTPIGSPVALVGGKATLAVSSTNGAGITATYSGDALYNASSAFYPFSAASGDVGGTVPATLALTLGAPASFGAFTPGITKDYTASTTASVTSTAGDATLSVSDPGHLANGAFTLPSPLTVSFSKASWTGPTSNDPVTIAFGQHIDATDALRTGAYTRTLTFTLSTTQP